MASNPFEILGLTSDATADEVKTRWKVLASRHHPDRGGDAEIFNSMRQAYKEAIKLASKPEKCSACNGAGKRRESFGFNSVIVGCQFCKGTGEIK